MAEKRLDGLQVLRGFAASAVVIHHCLRAVTVSRPAGVSVQIPPLLEHRRLIEIGAFGVDIFFILSGFLMIFIAMPYIERRRPISDFLANRLIRIWPLYALVTLLQCMLNVVVVLRTHVVPFDLQPLRLLSFIFIPSFDAKGLVQPIVGQGWTLNYEILFYACFALALWVAGKRALPALIAILSGLFLLGMILPTGSVARIFLFNSILFEFVLGGIIANFYLQDRLPKFPAPLWFVAGAGLLLLCSAWPADAGYRVLTRGVPAALLFVGMLRLESARANAIKWPPFLRLLGDASYSIYLFHFFVVFRVSPFVLLLVKNHGLPGLAAELAVVSSIIAAIASGIVVYLLVERPLLKYCKALYVLWFQRKPQVAFPHGAG